jgi:adenine-specific DNA-methyltransferase
LKNVRKGIPFPSIWEGVGYNNTASREILNFFGSVNIFDTPKPTSLIKEILNLSTGEKGNELILDFFAGSGTTGQAVLELNKEDLGNRKFIICTNNENNFCEEVCYPRIQKVILGYKDQTENDVAGIQGNLKYFRTKFVSAESTDLNKKRLVDKSSEMLCLKEDCYDKVLFSARALLASRLLL